MTIKMKNIASRWLIMGALSMLLVPGVRAQEDPEDEAINEDEPINTRLNIPTAPPQPDDIQWQPPTPAIRDTAKATNKLILIDFYADWCGVCQMQDETAYRDDRIILMTDQLVATKVDGDINTALAAQYEVNSYPTTVLLEPGGGEVNRKSGAFQEVEGYVEWLGAILYKDTVPKLVEALKKQPDDIKLLTIMALIHSGANRKTEVAGFLNKAGDAAIAKFEAGQKIIPDKAGQTARALRLLGLYFNGRQDYERAIPVLHYLTETSIRPREVVATHMTLAEAFFQMNQTPKAIAQLEALLKLQDVTPEEKQAAEAKIKEYKNVPA